MRKSLLKLALAAAFACAALWQAAAPAPALAFTCQDICFSEWNSCRLDCRFFPYPGCANDCWQEQQTCLAGC